MIELRPTVHAVLDELAVPNEAREAARDVLNRRRGTSWYLQLLAGVSAWAAASLVIGFIFVEILEQSRDGIPLGLLLVAVASVARRFGPTGSSFVRQLTVATMIAAEGLLLAGLADLHRLGDERWLYAAGVMFLALAAFPDRLHRFATTVLGAGFLCIWIVVKDSDLALHVVATPLYALALALFLWGPELDRRRFAPMVGPLAYGLLVVSFALLALVLWGPIAQQSHTWVSATGITAVVALGVVPLVSSEIRDAGATAIAATSGVVVALAVITGSSPGIIAGLGVLGVAFHRRNPLLFGFGTAAFAVCLFAWYYDLALTLWTKSGILIGSGAVLLVARAALLHFLPRESP